VIQLLSILILLVTFWVGGCTTGTGGPEVQKEGVTLVFKHGQMTGGLALLRTLLDRFEAAHPGVTVVDEALPASTDQQHQYYIINLEGRSQEFDLLSMDVIWIPEFSRAGWIRDLDHLLSEEAKADFFPSAREAATYQGRLHAMPWFMDAGLLYYRRDLLEKYGFGPPKTWEELVVTSKAILEQEADPKLMGFVWQGKQYEGLICNVLEFIWSRGGGVIQDGTVILDSPAAREALQFMRDLVTDFRVSPPLVTTADEEATRRIFGDGHAIFMRNWPYAWNLLQAEGSRMRGRVGVMPLPAFAGHAPAATLGGWHLGINRYSRHPREAEALAYYLTSPEVQQWFAIRSGYPPTRMGVYRDQELAAAQPFLSDLFEVFLTARPRPVTPYYLMFSQIMQPEFSAAVTGIKTPADALRSASLQMAHLLK